MFFFATLEQENKLLETSVGTCQFCGNKRVDLIEQRTKWYMLGCIPTSDQETEMVHCHGCKNAFKASYYTHWFVPRKHKLEAQNPNASTDDKIDEKESAENSEKLPLVDGSPV